MLRHFIVIWVAVGAIGWGCGKDEPSVEIWSAGAWTPVSIVDYAIDGRRDGRITQATAIFTLHDTRRLQVDFTITYDPVPALSSSEWAIDGATPGGGRVIDRSMKFFGGQGEGPSLGGGFRLDQDGTPAFRVHLPLQPIHQPDWGPRDTSAAADGG